MKNKLIYALKCPFTEEVHYIGKSTQGMIRPLQHMKKSHSSKVQDWVKELSYLGQKPQIEVLYYAGKLENIDDIEHTIIKKYVNQGANLLNSNLVKPLSILPNLEKEDVEGIKAIGEFIKIKRKSVKLKQDEFADKCGVSLSFLRALEQNSKDNFNTKAINQVLRMFGCKLGIEKII